MPRERCHATHCVLQTHSSASPFSIIHRPRVRMDSQRFLSRGMWNKQCKRIPTMPCMTVHNGLFPETPPLCHPPQAYKPTRCLSNTLFCEASRLTRLIVSSRSSVPESSPIIFQYIMCRQAVQEALVVGDHDQLKVGLSATISNDPACQHENLEFATT